MNKTFYMDEQTNLIRPIELIKRSFLLYWHKLSVLFPLGSIVLVVGLLLLLSIQTRSILLFSLSVVAGILVSYVVYLAMIRAISSPTAVSAGEAFTTVERAIVPAAWVSAGLVLIVFGG